MADGLNRVMLLGNLGSDPELRQTAGGESVLTMRLATSESYVDKSGERKEHTEWHTVVVWGKRGEGLARILRKGSRVCVEGTLRTREWEKDGAKHRATEVRLLDAYLCDGGGQGQSTSRAQQPRQPSRPQRGGFAD